MENQIKHTKVLSLSLIVVAEICYELFTEVVLPIYVEVDVLNDDHFKSALKQALEMVPKVKKTVSYINVDYPEVTDSMLTNHINVIKENVPDIFKNFEFSYAHGDSAYTYIVSLLDGIKINGKVYANVMK